MSYLVLNNRGDILSWSKSSQHAQIHCEHGMTQPLSNLCCAAVGLVELDDKGEVKAVVAEEEPVEKSSKMTVRDARSRLRSP